MMFCATNIVVGFLLLVIYIYLMASGVCMIKYMHIIKILIKINILLYL
jgi:hypothetical protein